MQILQITLTFLLLPLLAGATPDSTPARSALVSNATFVVNTPGSEVLRELKQPERREIELSSGTPLSSDGYVLTSAHSLEKATPGSVAIGVRRDGKLRWLPARIVWVDPTSDAGILKTSAVYSHPWKWSTTPIARNTSVLQGGIGNGIRTTAGRLLNPVAAQSDGRTKKFKHSISIVPGDSGGPVVTPDGQLLGINSSFTAFLPMNAGFFLEATAVRPDPAALNQRIAQDRKTHP